MREKCAADRARNLAPKRQSIRPIASYGYIISNNATPLGPAGTEHVRVHQPIYRRAVLRGRDVMEIRYKCWRLGCVGRYHASARALAELSRCMITTAGDGTINA